jgi:cell division septum initiation protein DivIVA
MLIAILEENRALKEKVIELETVIEELVKERRTLVKQIHRSSPKNDKRKRKEKPK